MNGEWPIVPIKELCESIFDGPHATPAKTESGPIFLGISNLADGRLDLADLEHLSEDDFARWTRRVLPQPDDLVFSYETRLGQAALIPEGLRCCLGRRMALIRPDLSKVDPQFLLFAYLAPEFQETLRSRTIHGSTVDRIPLIEFPNFPIRVPPLAEQRAIAGILGALDDKIALNRQMNATLEGIARALFQSWFVDFDPVHAKAEGRVPDGMDAETAALFPDSFADSALGPVPRGWRVVGLSEHANFVRGVSYKSTELQESDVALVTLKSIERGGGYRPDGLKPYIGKFKPAQKLEVGEIVVAHTDVTQACEVLGRVARVPSNPDFKELVASLDLAVVRPFDTLTNEFLYQLLSRDDFSDHAQGYSNGTTVLHLSNQALPSYRFVMPPVGLVRRFSEFAANLHGLIDTNGDQSRTLAELRDALLPKLVSGELRVGVSANS